MGLAAAGIGAATLGAAGSITSGIMGSNASSSASRAEQAAAQQAMALEQANLATATSNLQPYMTAGTNALSSIQQMLGIGGAGGGTPNYNAFTSSPGYQFQLNQGNQNIQNSATAGGGMTGNTLKAMQQFGQQQAGTSYQQFLQNLSSVAGSGQNAAGTLGSLGAGVAANMGAQTIGAGQDQAAGILGSSNALSGGINGALNAIGTAGTNYAGNQQIMALLAQLGLGGATSSANANAINLMQTAQPNYAASGSYGGDAYSYGS